MDNKLYRIDPSKNKMYFARAECYLLRVDEEGDLRYHFTIDGVDEEMFALYLLSGKVFPSDLRTLRESIGKHMSVRKAYVTEANPRGVRYLTREQIDSMRKQ